MTVRGALLAEVAELQARYCRAVDESDAALLRRILADDVLLVAANGTTTTTAVTDANGTTRSSWGRYRDSVVRAPDGRLLLASKRIEPAGRVRLGSVGR